MIFADQLPPISIVIADDEGILRDSLSDLLNRQPGMIVVATAASGLEAVKLVSQLKPRVVTIDLVLPLLSGLDASRRILKTHPDTRIIILSALHTSQHIFEALTTGALGYVGKQSAATDLITAIRTVAAGTRYVGPEVSPLEPRGFAGDPRSISPFDSLTVREREIMHLTRSGLSSAQAGRLLNLSRKTVETYRSRLMGKLGVGSLVELAKFAFENSMKSAL